ncbi:MAG: hypothetical protein VCA35_03120 [Roseibacillus sp.]
MEADVAMAENLPIMLCAFHRLVMFLDVCDRLLAGILGGEACAFGFEQDAEVDQLEERVFRRENRVCFEGGGKRIQGRICDVGAGPFQGAHEPPPAQLLDGLADHSATCPEAQAEFLLRG